MSERTLYRDDLVTVTDHTVTVGEIVRPVAEITETRQNGGTGIEEKIFLSLINTSLLNATAIQLFFTFSNSSSKSIFKTSAPRTKQLNLSFTNRSSVYLYSTQTHTPATSYTSKSTRRGRLVWHNSSEMERSAE